MFIPRGTGIFPDKLLDPPSALSRRPESEADHIPQLVPHLRMHTVLLLVWLYDMVRKHRTIHFFFVLAMQLVGVTVTFYT
jgi:hypothetical protein